MKNKIYSSTGRKTIEVLFFVLVCLSLLTPFWVFKDLLFPFVTSKAFYFRIVMELAFPFYLYLILEYKNYRPSIKNPINIAMLSFLVISIVSGLFGINVLKSFFGNFERMGGVYYLAHLTALYFYIQLLGQINQRYVQWFLQMLVGTSVLLAINGLSGWAGGPVLIQDPSLPLRVSSTFGNPIFFPSFLLIPTFLSAYFALQEDRAWLKVVYWVSVVLQLVAIYSSGTRGAVVGLVGGVGLAGMVYLFLNRNKYIRWYGGSLAVVLLAVAVFFFTHPQVLPQGSMVRRLFSLQDSNTQARLIQWKIALRGFKDSPILGTGGENYYAISNKYYDPEIYNYDKSWFDKPHNYLLEILVTNGLFGFLAYLGILIFGVWGLARGFRAGFLTLLEFSVLLAGLLVYQIQNLTVFDTISASVAFFILVGFFGYLWKETQKVAKQETKHSHSTMPAGLPAVVFGLSAVLMLYAVIASNFAAMKASKNVNYGYAYATQDPKLADGFFQKALQSPYNFDPSESTAKYLDFGNIVSQGVKGLTSQETEEIRAKTLLAGEQIVQSIPNDPISWQRLATAYLNTAIVKKSPVDPKVEDAIQHAIDLAPGRPEPQMVLTRLRLFQNNTSGAENILNGLISEIPKNTDAKMQLALIYLFTDRADQAAQTAEDALKIGYEPRQAGEISWLGDYYTQKQDFQNALRIYSLALEKEPDSEDVAWKLTQLYALTGDKVRAINLANAIATVNPSRKQEMDNFIGSFK